MKQLKNLGQLFIAVLLVISFQNLWIPMSKQALAETSNDPTPHINHLGTYQGKILFDNTHGETAGAADWVIDGGFSDFGNALAKQGYDVDELRKIKPITYDDLKDYDVYILGEANIPFKASEQAAMLQYVKDGGSIFFIGDHYNSDRNLNRWDSPEIYNGYRRGAWEDPTKGMSLEEANSEAMQGVVSSDWLGQNFGIRFRYNALGDITSGETIAPPSQSFGITEGVKSVEMHAGSTLAILDPSHAKGLVYLPKTTEAWPNAVDQGNYNGGGIAEGAFAAISKVGAGKAAFIGDSSPVEDPTPKYLREDNGQAKSTYDGFLGEGNDATYLVNVVNWLAKQEDYTSFDKTGIELDQPTQLYNFEIPQNSTEPESEPWTTPPTGYKWWDPSTFAPGSYGTDAPVPVNPKYHFDHQDTLPSGKEFDIRFVADDLAAGQTLSNLKVGVYLDGGKQIGKFQNPDGTVPSSYGYSQPFSVTADVTGHASFVLHVQLDDVAGNANLRVKQASKTLYTESNIPVGEASVVPLGNEEIKLPDVTDIQDIRLQKDNTLVTAEGVITTEPGSYGGQGFYLQDETGGIYVYQTMTGYHIGDQVKITALKTTYNNEIELSNPVKIENMGMSVLPEPKSQETVTADNQGEVIKLGPVAIYNLEQTNKYGSFAFDAVSGDVTTHVFVDNRTGLDYADFTALYQNGAILNVVGVASVINKGYELKVRIPSDLEQSFSLSQLQSLLDLGSQTGAISDGGILQSLSSKADSIENAPNNKSKHNKLEALSHEITAQTDKALSSSFSELLQTNIASWKNN